MKMESRAIGGYGHGYGHGGQHGNAGTGVSDFGESDVGDDVDSSYDTESQRSRSRAAMGTTGRSGVIRSAVVDEKTKRWLTAKTLLGAFSVMLALTMFGLIIAMVRKYGDSGLVHISFIFVGFTAAAPIVWQCIDWMAMCLRRNRRGMYPGAHVGVHISICLACVATMGYVGIWVSEGDHHWKYQPAEGPPLEYSPLYHKGIVLLIITAVLLLVNFILSIIACQEVRRKDDANNTIQTIVTVRYDGVGPTGTARPRHYHVPAAISLPAYAHRADSNEALSSPPIVIARGDLGVEIIESPTRTSVPPLTTGAIMTEKPGGSGLR